MKNYLIALLLIFTFVLFQPSTNVLQAQHAVGAKVLFLDYGTPNDSDSLGVTNGGELVYIRNLNRYLNFAIPFKAGVIDVKDDINNRTMLGADALLQLQFAKPESKIIPYIFGGGGVVIENFDETNVQFPAGAGLNFKVGQNSFINVQGEYRVSMNELRDNIQIGLGYIYQIGKTVSDQDGDGIIDEEDLCPDQPGKASTKGCPDTDNDGISDKMDLCPNDAGVVEFSGCPDTDGDGIPDRDDACPKTVGNASANGCPDEDGDGVADRLDECPTDAGTIKGCPDTDGDGLIDKEDDCPTEKGTKRNNGCPVSDEDGDGVPDSDDECPNEKGTKASRGCADRDGDGVADKYDNCPDKAGQFSGCPDTDGDGIDDYKDKCPNQAGLADNSGCPEIKEEEKEILDFAMRAVQFETGKSMLKVESYGVLNQIAEIMKKYPGYSLSINGHTDSEGSSSTNTTLSENRAKACFDYLAAQNIRITRLNYAGFGETQPISTNDTRAGRALNRRVEFILYIR